MLYTNINNSYGSYLTSETFVGSQQLHKVFRPRHDVRVLLGRTFDFFLFAPFLKLNFNLITVISVFVFFFYCLLFLSFSCFSIFLAKEER